MIISRLNGRVEFPCELVRVTDDTVMVKELGLNFFVCENFWGENVFIPVTTMLDLKIYNLSRSPPLWMRYTFHVDLGEVQAEFV